MFRIALTVQLVCLVSSALAGDWTQFRGPQGLGVSSETGVPLTWNDQENVAWKASLPGPGTSSPIVLDGRIYVTCYSGYGLDAAAPGKMDDLVRHLVCLDRATGTILWTKDFEPELPESAYRGGNDAKHGYASATPTTDGERLYVFFGKSGVYCLDLDGNEIWRSSVGDRTRGWGSANSPVLFENLVIVNASVESNSLVALDKMTGQEVWRADGMRASWNTPALVRTVGGDTELVVSVEDWLLAFDPSTGDELWRCEGIPTYVCPSFISHDGVAYITGGRGTQYTIAVRTGGRGDVTDSHVVWRISKGSNVSSPVYHDGHLFVASDNRGLVYCIDAESGEVLYQERLRPSPGLIYSSPVVVDDRVYFVSQHDGVYVIPAGPEFDLLSHNEFTEDDARTNASLVIDNGQILLRNDRHLYCLGEGPGN